jgi:hypothetical protein
VVSFFKDLTEWMRYLRLTSYLGLDFLQGEERFWNKKKGALRFKVQGWRGISWATISRAVNNDRSNTHKAVRQACERLQNTLLRAEGSWLFGHAGIITFGGIRNDLRRYTQLYPFEIARELQEYVEKACWDELACRLIRDREYNWQLFTMSGIKCLKRYGLTIEKKISHWENAFFTWECTIQGCMCNGKSQRAQHVEWFELYDDFKLVPKYEDGERGVIQGYVGLIFPDNSQITNTM